MTIELRSKRPLCLTTDTDSDLLDAGSAYSYYLRSSGGSSKKNLSGLVRLIPETVNPQSRKHRATMFEYIDLAEVEETIGAITTNRKLQGKDIASTKVRFQHGDILFAKIRPSIDNKKVAYVFQEYENAIASTEFLVLRPIKREDVFFIFAALRSDDLTSQVIACCGGDTGRQRILPSQILGLSVPWPHKDVRSVASKAVEEQLEALAKAFALREQALEIASQAVGSTTFQTAKPRRKMTSRRDCP